MIVMNANKFGVVSFPKRESIELIFSFKLSKLNKILPKIRKKLCSYPVLLMNEDYKMIHLVAINTKHHTSELPNWAMAIAAFEFWNWCKYSKSTVKIIFYIKIVIINKLKRKLKNIQPAPSLDRMSIFCHSVLTFSHLLRNGQELFFHHLLTVF